MVEPDNGLRAAVALSLSGDGDTLGAHRRRLDPSPQVVSLAARSVFRSATPDVFSGLRRPRSGQPLPSSSRNDERLVQSGMYVLPEARVAAYAAMSVGGAWLLWPDTSAGKLSDSDADPNAPLVLFETFQKLCLVMIVCGVVILLIETVYRRQLRRGDLREKERRRTRRL